MEPQACKFSKGFTLPLPQMPLTTHATHAMPFCLPGPGDASLPAATLRPAGTRRSKPSGGASPPEANKRRPVADSHLPRLPFWASLHEGCSRSTRLSQESSTHALVHFVRKRSNPMAWKPTCSQQKRDFVVVRLLLANAGLLIACGCLKKIAAPACFAGDRDNNNNKTRKLGRQQSSNT